MQQGLLSAFNPSDAYSQNLRQPVQGDMTLGNLVSYFMPISRNVMPYEDSPRLGAGDYNLDFPQLMKDAYSGINKFGQAFRGELSPQEIQQLAFDTSMNVTGGSLLGSRVIPNAVPSGGILGMGVSKTPNQTGLLGKKQSPSDLRKQANIERFGYDPNEVVDTSYRLQHKPNPDGARLDDMTKGGEVFPDDIYSSNGLLYYGNPKSLADRQSFEVIQKVKGNPDAEVTIYRAVPNQDNITTINSGDFVTLSEDYAKLHGQGGYGADGSEAGKILSKKVKVRDLFSEGNDLNEFGYFPSKETASQTGLLGKVDNVQPKSGVSEVVPPTDKSDGIIAFHGSPYDFNQFSLSKINTGEGAQAFGHGLYFSSKEAIAKFYRDSVRGFKDLSGQTDWKYKGKSFEMHPDDAQNIEDKGVALLVQEMRLTSRYPEKAKETLIKKHEKEIKRLQQITKGMRDRGYYPNMPDDILGLGADIELEELIIGSLQREIDAVKKINLSDIKQSKGSMYQVKLNTINDDLIDYDKTLKDQPAILKRLNNLIEVKTLKSKYNKDIDNLTGKQFYEFLESNKATPRKDVEVSKQLNEVGIKGIQYLDNSSRGERFSIKLSTNKGAYDHEPIQSGDRNQIEELAEDYRKKGFKVKIEQGGDKNYVIFDDKIIDIMKKYGIVGAVGVTAMQGRGNQSSEADLSL